MPFVNRHCLSSRRDRDRAERGSHNRSERHSGRNSVITSGLWEILHSVQDDMTG